MCIRDSITDKGYEEIDPEASYFIYVDDQSGWGDLALYISGAGDNNEDWPGLEPAGTKEINGVVYKYFETDEVEITLEAHSQRARAGGSRTESGSANGPRRVQGKAGNRLSIL